jgi:hypothetical protein
MAQAQAQGLLPGSSMGPSQRRAATVLVLAAGAWAVLLLAPATKRQAAAPPLAGAGVGKGEVMSKARLPHSGSRTNRPCRMCGRNVRMPRITPSELAASVLKCGVRLPFAVGCARWAPYTSPFRWRCPIAD